MRSCMTRLAFGASIAAATAPEYCLPDAAAAVCSRTWKCGCQSTWPSNTYQLAVVSSCGNSWYGTDPSYGKTISPGVGVGAGDGGTAGSAGGVIAVLSMMSESLSDGTGVSVEVTSKR